jgi:hypothetical protein
LHGDEYDVHYNLQTLQARSASENVEALGPSIRKWTIKAQELQVGFITEKL